jgi:signal transduction histidine kinase/DNA-binding response OmpR family regulator
MADSDKANILVVDDLPEKLLVIESVLEELGQNVITARSGEEALRRLLEREFAVILLDVNMPGIDGYETAALIRRRKKSAHTPIIFITAFADEMHTAHGYSLGAVDYIFSPVVPEVLRTKVRVFVELARMTQQVRRRADERVALARAEAARAVAEESTRRLAFLAEASKALAHSLDVAATLRGLPRLAVPFLADLSGVTLVAAPGQPWHSELAWTFPPAQEVHAATLTVVSGDAACAEPRTPRGGPRDALRAALERSLASGRTEILDGLDVPYPPAGCDGPPAPAGASISSAVVLPLVARGRTLGALTLAMAASGRRFEAADLALAEDLAGRAAVALDNAALYQNIQENDRRKDEFLAMLAHELRNPLAPVRNAVEILRLLGLKYPPLVQARDMIDRQVTHMARLIDDLLDVSRLSRGKILLRVEWVDLARLVRSIVEDYRTAFGQSAVALEADLAAGPLWARGDPTRLAQVVGNVLHNANKFTDRGGRVTVALTVEGRGEARRAVLTVRDTGIGMEPAMLARVFEAFSQADRSLDRSRGGLGLGLTLVRGLVVMHGGEVKVASDGLGHGTQITILVPLGDGPPPVAPAHAPARVLSRRVLVIEDSPDAAESMRVLLTLTGHEVAVALNGATGVAKAREFRPEVVLCDIGLPGGMDGYDVARTLRCGGDPAVPYLVAVTGYGQADDQRRAAEAGFDAHLTRPVDFDDLQELLASLSAPAPA